MCSHSDENHFDQPARNGWPTPTCLGLQDFVVGVDDLQEGSADN